MEKFVLTLQVLFSGIAAWISAKLGILSPVLLILLIMMIIDYLSGMAASKAEALEHPDDPQYGWSSKREPKESLKKWDIFA